MDAKAVQENRKLTAVRRALDEVQDGMLLGLGSGTTAERMVVELGERVRAGLRVTCVATSQRIDELARTQNIPLVAFDDVEHLDVTIDGADEIHLPTFSLIKGRGGALLREKLVASVTRREVIVADDSKLVHSLGQKQPVPVEIVRFGWKQTAARVAALGCTPTLRRVPETHAAFVTDEGNLTLDCAFGVIADPSALAARIKAVVGVVEHGIFIGHAQLVVIGRDGGAEVYAP